MIAWANKPLHLTAASLPGVARTAQVNGGVGQQRLRERPDMLTKPIGQVHPVDPAGGEIEERK